MCGRSNGLNYRFPDQCRRRAVALQETWATWASCISGDPSTAGATGCFASQNQISLSGSCHIRPNNAPIYQLAVPSARAGPTRRCRPPLKAVSRVSGRVPKPVVFRRISPRPYVCSEPRERQSRASQIVTVIVLTARRDGLQRTPRIRFATRRNLLGSVRPVRAGDFFRYHRIGCYCHESIVAVDGRLSEYPVTISRHRFPTRQPRIDRDKPRTTEFSKNLQVVSIF